MALDHEPGRAQRSRGNRLSGGLDALDVERFHQLGSALDRGGAAGFAQRARSLSEVEGRAVERARELASLPPAAYDEQKRRLREATQRAVLQRLPDDITALAAWWRANATCRT